MVLICCFGVGQQAWLCNVRVVGSSGLRISPCGLSSWQQWFVQIPLWAQQLTIHPAVSLFSPCFVRRDLLALPAISEPEVAGGVPVDSSSSFGASRTDSSSVDQDAEPASSDSSSHCRAVVHLMVHKSAKVNW
jgi:hypothetical protein